MVSRHWVDSHRIAARYIRRESADGRSMYLSRCLSVCTVFSPLPIGLKKKYEKYWKYWILITEILNDFSFPSYLNHSHVEIPEKYAYLDLFRSVTWKHAFLCNSIPFCDIFFLWACTKVEPNLFRLWVVFFAFSLSCCFCPFAEVADCLLGFQAVKEFSRQHHPNGKLLPSDEEGNYPPSFSLKFLNVSVYIWSSITLCKKRWGAYATPAVCWCIVLCLYSFALHRMSFRDFPLRYKRRLCNS